MAFEKFGRLLFEMNDGNDAESFAMKNKRKLALLKDEVQAQLKFVNDFPRPGIKFVDVMGLMRFPALLEELCLAIAEHARAEIPVTIDAVAGLEARGFLFGPQIAIALNVPFIPIRKKGKLPGKTISQTYTKEYGEDVIEIQESAITPEAKVLLVDDLLATGGTLKAAIALIEKAGGEVAEAFSLVELSYLRPREALPSHIPIFSLITFDE